MAALEQWQIALAVLLMLAGVALAVGLLGEARLNLVQRRCLLVAPDRADHIARYLRVHTLLQPCGDQRRLIWRRARHEHRAYRSVVKIARLACYIGSCLLAFLPVYTWTLVHGAQAIPARLALLQAGFCIVFACVAFWSLRWGQRLARAELLVGGDSDVRGHALGAVGRLDRAYMNRRAAND